MSRLQRLMKGETKKLPVVELTPMASRLVEVVDGLIAEMIMNKVAVPAPLVALLQKMMCATPPQDEDILSTFATIQSHMKYVEEGVR